MRSMERSHSRGIDQAHVADDRNNIETRKHGGGTTWDDLINVPFGGNRSNSSMISKDAVSDVKAMKALIDSLPTDVDDEIEQAATAVKAEQQMQTATVADAREQVLNAYSGDHGAEKTSEADRVAALERVDRLRLPDNELIELTAEWGDVEINQETLREATEKNGNPNVHGKGLFFGSGNLPMSDDSVYRHVGSSAVVDLMIQGFVRNKREAADALDIPGKRGFGTEGAGVYWYDGDSQKREKADLVIQASKAAAERGYVTKDDVQGIWVTDKNTGQPVNLIDGQDHTGLEMADHKQ